MDSLIGWLGAAYPWVKAVHLIFVIFWMAGLFMLPRFLVYHQEAAIGSPEAALWVTREARLAAIILNPSMIVVWALAQHSLSGVRHLLTDFDIGSPMRVARRSAWFVNLAGVAVAALAADALKPSATTLASASALMVLVIIFWSP